MRLSPAGHQPSIPWLSLLLLSLLLLLLLLLLILLLLYYYGKRARQPTGIFPFSTTGSKGQLIFSLIKSIIFMTAKQRKM